ncbi:hypothetical protein LY76DRAFT_296157 [Colletotrichum caudatum]|nr:hypothetical protein LY76DRAFT_296157 [Colletotrichum caudatum]
MSSSSRVRTPQEIIDTLCKTLETAIASKNTILPSLEEYEALLTSEPYFYNVCDARRAIPLEIAKHAVQLLPPTGSFSVTSRNTAGLLRKAATNWGLSPKHILFAVAFDLTGQGETFFRLLRDFSAISPNWSSSITLLCRLANQRRSEARQSRRPGVHTSGSGPSCQDIKLAIASLRTQSLPAKGSRSREVSIPPSISLPDPAIPSDHLDVPEAVDAPDLNKSIGPASPPHKPASPFECGSTPAPNSPFGSSIPDTDSNSNRHLPLDNTILSEPEEPTRPNTPRKPSSPSASRSISPEAGRADASPSGPDLLAPLDPGNTSYYDNADTGSDISLDLEDHPPQDDDSVVLPLAPSPPPTSAGISQCNNQAQPASQRRLSQNVALYRPSKRPWYKIQAHISEKLTSAMAKRSRLGQEADILDEGRMIEGRWLNDTLGRVCTCTGAYLVDSLESVSMVSGDYVAKSAIRQAIGSKSPILLPIFARNHWALAVFERGRIAMQDPALSSVLLYDSLPSVGIRADASAQVAAFIRHYLPGTPDHLYSNPVPMFSPKQTNGIDCGVFVFAFGMHAVARWPLRAQLDPRLWRRIMAALAFVDVATWQAIVPALSKGPQPPPPLTLPTRSDEAGTEADSPLQILEAATRAVNDWHKALKVEVQDYYERESAKLQEVL